MQKGLLLLVSLFVSFQLFSQKSGPTANSADNGLTLEGTVFKFGGTLNKSTTLNGSLKSLYFNSLDSFNTSSNITRINSLNRLLISSNDLLNLIAKNLVINASAGISISGNLSLNSYRNNIALDSILTVDASGNLRLVAKDKPAILSATNGLTYLNNAFSLGGDLQKSTTLNGNLHSFDFSNLSNFDVNATQTSLNGAVKFGNYKNTDGNSLLTVDASGNLMLVAKPVLPPPPAQIIYDAENGLVKEDNTFRLGGSLNRSTQINGSLHSLRISNVDRFSAEGKSMSLNSTGKTTLSANDSLNLSSGVISLNATNNNIAGNINLGNYRNNAALDSVLTVDESGNLKLVRKDVTAPTGNGAYGAENGLTLQNNIFSLGGQLKKATLLNGNDKSLRFTNLDTFFLGGRHIQFLNSTKKTTISSFDSLNLLSFGSMVLSANHVTVDGSIKLAGYKNSADMDSVLTVDNCGALKLVSQKSLQTIAQNAFMNNGNSFAAAANLGTNDAFSLSFKTNNIVRGSIDASGLFNYNFGININNAKLKTTGDLEINGSQPFATASSQKASKGINFVDGGENLARGTISFNSAGMNYTSHGAIRFYSSLGGVALANSFPDFVVSEGVFQFGGRKSRSQPDELSAAYHFKNHFDDYGQPRGVLFPNIQSFQRGYQPSPAIGLMFFNKDSQNLEIYKSDGWHRFVTQNVNTPVTSTNAVAPSTGTASENSNSFVQALGDGQQKSFKISHNLNAQYVMVQFIDCGPEANCNLLQILPKGARVELDGKNNALVTFDEAPSFNRYKIMFLRVQ
jgi:hypothetical protein